MEGYAVYLKTLLEPLGIYDLTENSISGGELCALGGELDAVNGQLERAERATICMMETPVSASPFSTDHCTGALPRYFGSSETCRLMQP